MKCENCLIEIDGTFGSGRFCSRVCACTFVSKQNREVKNKKVSLALTKEKIEKFCPVCNYRFLLNNSKSNQVYCSSRCRSLDRWKDEAYRNRMTLKIKERCSNLTERKRLRDIGRKGGFGKKGELENGIKYSSNLEKICFEYLIKNKIKFIPHKNIPNSSKITDIYIEDIDLYIELDGINREKKQKWLEKEYKYWLNKLDIYKNENLNFKVIYNFNEFENFINTEFKTMEYFCDNKRHLVCKPYSIENLHLMAKDLGINICWFHKNHYDIPKGRIQDIMEQCTVVSPKEIVKIIKGLVV